MPKLSECNRLAARKLRCQRYSYNLVCTIHPISPDTAECLDFAPNAGAMAAGRSETIAEDWSETIADAPPELSEGGFYAGELVASSRKRLSRQEQLELLETHPLLVGALSVGMS